MLKHLPILLALLLFASCKVPRGIVNAPPPKQQGSHFFSQTEKTKEFALNDLDTGRALVLILKPKADVKDIDFELENRLKFEVLSNGKSKKTCNMNTLNGLCVLPKVDSKDGNTLKVTCSQLPCEYTFDAIQLPDPELAARLKNDSLQYLYKINANESLIKVKSNDPNVQNLAAQIRVYANAPYELVNNDNNLLYYDFDQFVDYVLIYPHPEVQKSIRVKIELAPEDVGFDTMYRFTVNKTKEIKIERIPSKELRVDMTLAEVNEKPLQKLNISFVGYKSSSSSDPIEIQTFTIDQMDDGGVLDLNLILKHNAFTSLNHFSMKIDSPQVLLVSFQLVDSNVHELEVEEESYISIDKDETVEYQIVSSSDSDSQEVVKVVVLDQDKKDKVTIELSPDPCYYDKGCTMKVKAKQAVVMGLGIVFDRKIKDDLRYIPLKTSVELLLAEGETMHLMHNQTSVKSKKITVNSGNVLVYVAGQKCPLPSPKCHQYAGSLQKPILIQNPTYPMYVTVVGLQSVKFTIRVDEADSIVNLADGIALTQTITGNEGLYFRFKIKQKEEVNFNLIAPLNAFKMYIGNSNQKPNVEDVNLEMSTNYVKYEKNEIDELVFTILVKKVDNSTQDSFTIIASTSSAIIVLGKGEPHYDVISQDQTKHYVIIIHEKDIEDDLDTHISFSIFQAIDNPSFTFKVGTDHNDMKNQTKIKRRHDLINIEQYAAELCIFNESDICEFYFSLTSHNSQRLDVTLTLLSNNSVIELKPGVWQSFQMASLTASSHFYFIPTNKKYPINLQFTHTYGSFKISYLLWKNENQVNDAGLWPFPTQTSSLDVKAAFQTSDYVIHTDEISKCFPNCILLISLVDTDKPEQKDNQDPNVVAPIFSRFGSYSIMASNNMMELKEMQKTSITLAKNQSKYVTIDLSPYLKNDTNVISIHSTSMVGFTSILGKLSSNRNPQFPTENDNDYRLMGPQIQIKMEDVKQKLQKMGMDEHQEIQLILMLKALLHSRIIISFTSKENYIERLAINVPQDVHLPKQTVKYFSIEYYQDVKVKIVRIAGFPAFAWATCPVKDFDKCIDDLEKNPGSTINSKIDQVNVKYREVSITVLKFIAKDDAAEFEVSAIGGNAATQLKQGQTINDFVEKKETNRYKVSVVKQTETIITVTVFEGNPQVTVRNDYEGIKMTGKKKGNLIQLHVPSSAFKKTLTNTTNNGTQSNSPTTPRAVFSNTALSSIFSELIVEVSDVDFNCSYSISFTIGKRNLFIQDGTLTSGTLRPDEEILYAYHNSKSSTAFVAISFQNSGSLEKCEVEYASFTEDQDQEPVLKAPAKLQVKSRAPKPTITFQLQQKYVDFQIKLKNKDSKDMPFNITINHVDIVLLPYGYKYPTYVGKNQSAYFVIEVFNQGYIQFDLRKCTENPLTFSYALDDQSFEDESYTYTSEVEDYRFSSFVHVKVSTIFLRVQTEDPALFSIEANWYKDKKSIPNNKIKPGANGVLEYVITGEKTATVSFAPLNCEDCHSNNVTYEYLLGKSRSDVLTQTACQGNFFLFAPIQTIKAQTVKPKPSKVESGKLTFDVKLPDQLAYLGLKAKLSDGRQVFYSVVELSTIWGSIQKNKNYHLGLMTFSVFMVVFCCYMYRRRPEKKKGKGGAPYQDLPQEFDP